ncbi:MAG: hypothetical protein HY926_03535 [Elusimicrobia bacterium]|nr:hypothetical protein [Elusimicrobiota bacterium]
MSDKDSLDKLNDQVSGDVPAIPDLKKKDKERKRAGAAWGGARPVGAPFSGATGGSGAAGVQAAAGVGRAAVAAAPGAAPGAAGAVPGAAGASGWLSFLFPSASGGWAGGASASFLSKAMIGVGLASLLAGVGLYAFVKMREKPAGPEGAGLAPIYDTIQINRNASDKRLQMAADAGRGQFQFGPKPAEEAAAETAEAKAETPSAEKPADNPWGDVLSAVQGPQGFAAQNLAGLPSGSSGSGSMGGLFSALTGARSGGRSPGGMPSLRYPGQKGTLSGALARGATRSTPATGMSTRKIRAGRAFAQLRYARSQSLVAARGGSSEQGMKATATDAFEQNDGQAASGAGIIGPVDSPVAANPGTSNGEYGSGTPTLLSDPNELPTEPPSETGAINPNTQNYQNAMDAIKQLAAMAAKLKMISMILIAIGIALIAAGCAMTPVGWGLIAAGIALVAMGIMMLMMAKQMGAQAQAMAQQLESAYGQQYQQENVDACVNQAIANGTDPNACQSPNPDPHYGDSASDASGVQQATSEERNSNWEYDDGTPASQQ